MSNLWNPCKQFLIMFFVEVFQIILNPLMYFMKTQVTTVSILSTIIEDL